MIWGALARKTGTSGVTQRPGAGITWKHLILRSGAWAAGVRMDLWPLREAWATSQRGSPLTWLLRAPSTNILEGEVEVTGFFSDQVLEVTRDHICGLLLAAGESRRPAQMRTPRGQ